MGDIIKLRDGNTRQPVKRKRDQDRRQVRERSRSTMDGLEETLSDLGIKTFDREYRRLRKMVDGDDFTSSKAAYALLRSQLAMCIQALPILERNIHRYGNERAAYALVSLSGHIRELTHDMMAYGDQSEIAERVRAAVIQPLIRDIATSVVQEIIAVRQETHRAGTTNLGKRLDERLRLLQESLATSFTKAESEAAQSLNRALDVRSSK